MAWIAIGAVHAAGCGFGAGEASPGTATLTVTRDYGSEQLATSTLESPPETETVLRLLDRETEIATRYGGGFVQAIEGIEGEVDGDRNFDWFFYVNGIESSIGSAEAGVRGGDRIWWDHRDWTDAMRVPAVVGSFPEPFLQASATGERLPVRVECARELRACDQVKENLADEGIVVDGSRGGTPDADALRILVGTWDEVRHDPAASGIGAGPAQSGVFARFARGGAELVALDTAAEPVARLGEGAGLVAAVRDGEDPVTWLVSGVDGRGVEAAAQALDEDVLRDRYAVVVGAGSEDSLPLPVVEAP